MLYGEYINLQKYATSSVPARRHQGTVEPLLSSSNDRPTSCNLFWNTSCLFKRIYYLTKHKLAAFKLSITDYATFNKQLAEPNERINQVGKIANLSVMQRIFPGIKLEQFYNKSTFKPVPVVNFFTNCAQKVNIRILYMNTKFDGSTNNCKKNYGILSKNLSDPFIRSC